MICLDVCSLICIPTIVVAWTTWMVRRGKTHIQLFKEQIPTHERKEYQFSILQIMILTLVVALALSFGKIAREGIREENIAIATSIIFNSLLALSIIVITHVCVWASLGLSSPIVKIPIAFVMAMCIGFLPAYIFLFIDVREMLFLFGGLSILQALIVSCTLLIFRSLGYRLVAIERNTIETDVIESREAA